MRGRKLLALCLCLALSLGVVSPALAQEAAADQALMAVTTKVKAALDLDTELYDDFQGWSEEDVLLGKRWKLNWSADGRELSVTADDQGKIYSYNYSYAADEQPVADVWYSGGRLTIPSLPEDKSQAAFQTAQAFLDRVLDPALERVELENTYRPSLTQNSYRYSGAVLLNGLPSPIDCSITVRSSDLAVLRFWRGDERSGYVGSVPSPATTVSQAQARRLLRSTVDMEAKYVLLEDGKTARVQYVPLYGHEYYVDGVTGQLIDLTELQDKLWRGDNGANKFVFTTADAAPEAAADLAAGLTQAEKEGAAILSDALAKEELDRVVKNAWPEIGLDKYTLASASYSVREKDIEAGAQRTSQDYEVTCRLTYGKQSGTVSANKHVTVDAKTGALKSLTSTRYDRQDKEEADKWSVNTSVKTAQATAEKALASFAGGNYGKLALFSADEAGDNHTWRHTFQFQQTANGYFFDGNSYTLAVDATDGTLALLNGYFNEEVQLVAPAKVISKDQAIEIYTNALDMPYGYLEVPVSISLAGGDLMPLLKDAGYTYVTTLKTGFGLTQPSDRHVSGVDAETGEVTSWTFGQGEERQIAYDDIDGHWVQAAAQALAVFNVGFAGGSLKPGETLTQRDMLALLCSVDGYWYDPAAATQDETDWLYRHAYSLGLVTPETRQEDKAVTRGELVKLILDAAGYEKVAAIPGIFRCDYADAADLPAGELGYAALAQGLGLVKGGSDGSYAPARSITRAEALSMLYQYMK